VDRYIVLAVAVTAFSYAAAVLSVYFGVGGTWAAVAVGALYGVVAPGLAFYGAAKTCRNKTEEMIKRDAELAAARRRVYEL